MFSNVLLSLPLFFRKWSGSSSSSASSTVQAILNAPLTTTAPESPSIDVSSQSAEVTDGEWTYDPNEPRYCLCNQVSYGDMVACDNEEVRLVFYCFLFIHLFFCSVPLNGFIIHVLVSLLRQKGSGIVPSVLPV